MNSFWYVEDGVPIKNIGRPRSFKGTSFAPTATDDNFSGAGLYRNVEWAGTYDQRIETLSEPRFIVDEPTKEVRVEYDIVAKSQAEIDDYDAAFTKGVQDAADAVALQAEKDTEFASTIPSWAQVDTAITNISNLAEAKAFLRKLARVVYLTNRNKID
jgi:hypothetical protein|tara:strand:- start:64 stop:537 length:474 start_codon:yes stop_codon:yes gene_type:complete